MTSAALQKCLQEEAVGIDTASWEDLESNLTSWRSKLKQHLTSRKKTIQWSY